MGEDKDFQMTNGNTAITNAIWDMVLSCIVLSIQITYA